MTAIVPEQLWFKRYAHKEGNLSGMLVSLKNALMLYKILLEDHKDKRGIDDVLKDLEGLRKRLDQLVTTHVANKPRRGRAR